jgi:hypothetical protein
MRHSGCMEAPSLSDRPNVRVFFCQARSGMLVAQGSCWDTCRQWEPPKQGIAAMTDGDDVMGKHCARCYTLLTPPMVYHDGLWFHHSCWRAGVEQLRNATRLAAVSVPPRTSS